MFVLDWRGYQIINVVLHRKFFFFFGKQNNIIIGILDYRGLGLEKFHTVAYLKLGQKCGVH